MIECGNYTIKTATDVANEITPEDYMRFESGFSSVDKILSSDGGLGIRQVVTIHAPRGSGKTTLILQLISGLVENNENYTSLYSSGEEHVKQIAMCAQRIELNMNFSLVNINLLEDYLDIINSGQFNNIVIDSLPTVQTNMRLLNNKLVNKDDVDLVTWKQTKAVTKGIAQECFVKAIYNACHKCDVSAWIILHQTKGGVESGTTGIQHTVDTCLKVHTPTNKEVEEGVYHEDSRVLLVDNKNRLGTSSEAVEFQFDGKGWHLNTPLTPIEKPEEAPKSEDPRKVKAAAEVNKIKTIMATQSNISLENIIKGMELDESDVTGANRIETRVKTLEKEGIAVKVGRGASAIYNLGAMATSE